MASNPVSDVPLASELKLDESKRVPIPEPPNEAEKRVIWKSQVLIPFTVNGTFRAMLGPLKEVKKGKPDSLPKGHESFHPSTRGDELILAFRPSYHMPFLPDPRRAFHSALPSPHANDGAYLKWLNRVESARGKQWKKVGIFDLIQLLRSPILYNPAMLLSSFYFWERATNCFHVPFGMITPTLLDVAAGLWPIGDDYHSTHVPTNPIFTPTANMAFSTFVKKHGASSGDVSDAEHVAFLLYWLFAYVFCTKSMRIPAKLLSLANLLHEGRQISMARLVLGNLYQLLNEIVADLRDPTVSSLNAAGPLWLLQLRLNSVLGFYLLLRQGAPSDYRMRIDAHMLETLTPFHNADNFESDFRKYFVVFRELERFHSSFAPYSKPVYGPSWLTRSYPNTESPEPPKKHHVQLWQTLLSPRVLIVGFSSNDFTLCGYNPQLVARQFGLSQVLPNTLFDKYLVLYPGVVTKAHGFPFSTHYLNMHCQIISVTICFYNVF